MAIGASAAVGELDTATLQRRLRSLHRRVESGLHPREHGRGLVAKFDAQFGLRRHDVGGARPHGDDAEIPHRIRAAGRAQALRQVCRKAEHRQARIAAHRHGRRSGVIGAAAKAHDVAAYSDDAGHDADIDRFGDRAAGPARYGLPDRRDGDGDRGGPEGRLPSPTCASRSTSRSPVFVWTPASALSASSPQNDRLPRQAKPRPFLVRERDHVDPDARGAARPARASSRPKMTPSAPSSQPPLGTLSLCEPTRMLCSASGERP